jgi:SAM-dependent methyltransferase
VSSGTPAERMAEVARRAGGWQSHNVYVGDGLWTISGDEYAPDVRLRRVLQLAADTATRPLSEMRVLDLACEEGVFGIELARRGARTLGVEGRAVHVERARFAARELGLAGFEVRQGDVRELSAEREGEWDLILCLGLLYHLDAPDVFEFVHDMAAMCRRALVLDTHVAVAPRKTREHRGRSYSGTSYREHSPGAGAAEREDNLRASLDNRESFWLTRPSLFNLLVDAGFTSVLESQAPRTEEQGADEVVLVAIKGEPQAPAGTPSGQPPAWPRLAERAPRRVHPGQTLGGRLRALAGRARRR